MALKINLNPKKIMKTIAETSPAILLPTLARMMGVATLTMASNLAPLLESGQVCKANIGTVGKPIYAYYLPDKGVYSVHSEIIDHEDEEGK